MKTEISELIFGLLWNAIFFHKLNAFGNFLYNDDLTSAGLFEPYTVHMSEQPGNSNVVTTCGRIAFCKYVGQECIPVGCVPAARWQYAGVCFRGGEVGGVCLGGSALGGCLLPGAGVCSQGGMLPGVSARGGGLLWRVSAPRGGCLLPGCVCLLPGGVCLLPGGFCLKHAPPR